MRAVFSRNADGERFMERYAPTIKDPRTPRYRGTSHGKRGARGPRLWPHKDYVLLDLTHLEPSHIDEKLPDITEFARTYLAVEPHHQPIPVFPTAHYAMGGDSHQQRDRGVPQQRRDRPRPLRSR